MSASAAEAIAGIAMNSAKALTIIVFIAISPSANYPFAGITASETFGSDWRRQFTRRNHDGCVAAGRQPIRPSQIP
jgi:hypothetical protein